MRGLVSLETSGLQEFIDEMEGFVAAFPEISREALKAQEEVVVDKIKQNWVSIAGGKTGDFVYSSIGLSTELSKINDHSVVGTVGVYKLDAVDSAFNRTKSDMNAAQISYWVEFGTSRLAAGGRKKKNTQYSPDELITVAPKPFLSNAMYGSINEQETAFKIKFNELADQYRYSGA